MRMSTKKKLTRAIAMFKLTKRTILFQCKHALEFGFKIVEFEKKGITPVMMSMCYLFCMYHGQDVRLASCKRNPICRNPNFGLVTKVKGLQGCGSRRSSGAKAKRPQGCGPKGSPGVTSHTPENARKCEGVNTHTPKTTPTLGHGIPVDS
jgi:hypothetical protein